MCLTAKCVSCGSEIIRNSKRGPLPKQCDICRCRKCLECGKEFFRRPKGVDGKNDKALFCTKACYFAARNAGRVAWDRTNIKKRHWHKGGPYSSCPSMKLRRLIQSGYMSIFDAVKAMADLSHKELNRPCCEHCGAPCKDGATRFCSYYCNKMWRGVRHCTCGAQVANATAFGPPPMCKECKRKSLREWRRCAKTTRKRVRRGGGYWNAEVRALDVFKRDKWICYICHKKCHNVYDPNDPLSATVDHVYPVVHGGDHDWHNVRTACSMCNATKSDKIIGQRRFVFG